MKRVVDLVIDVVDLMIDEACCSSDVVDLMLLIW